MSLRIVRVLPNAVLPVRGSVQSAGLDLSAAVATTIPAGGKGIVKTGLKMAVPDGTYGRIAPRSGLSWKKHIDVGGACVLRTLASPSTVLAAAFSLSLSLSLTHTSSPPTLSSVACTNALCIFLSLSLSLSPAGVIDGDYRGEVGVVLFNHGAEDLVVSVGDRVAQLVLEKIAFVDPTEVTSLEDTVRCVVERHWRTPLFLCPSSLTMRLPSPPII